MGRSPQSQERQEAEHPFYHTKAAAKRRGIPFHLSRKQWTWLWERALGLDWRKLRGQRRGQYCIARFGDRGAYELGNVEIILSAENVRRGKTGRHTFPELNGVLSLPT